mgnify:CR=1 FL=1
MASKIECWLELKDHNGQNNDSTRRLNQYDVGLSVEFKVIEDNLSG